MTEVAPGTKVRFVRPDGVAALVRDAIARNLAGVRDLITQTGGNVVEVPQNPDGSWPLLATRRPGIRYKWVARYQPTRLPDASVGAVDGDEVTGHASMWVGVAVAPSAPGDTTTPTTPPPTTPVERVPMIAETFTGVTDGSVWPAARWTIGARPAGGGADVYGGAGRITTGTVGSWAPADMASVRAVTLLRDVEAVFDFILTTDETRMSFHARSDSGILDTVNGVSLDVTPSSVVLAHATGGAWSTDVTTPKTHARGTTYRARVIVATQTGGATLIRARTWPTAAAEPTTWDIDTTTVPAPKTPGYTGFTVPGIGAGRGVVTLDNVTFYDRPPADGSGWGTWVG